MGITKLEDVVAWDTKSGVFCTDCESNPDDKAVPILDGEYDAGEYIVTCDKCKKRIV